MLYGKIKGQQSVIGNKRNHEIISHKKLIILGSGISYIIDVAITS